MKIAMLAPPWLSIPPTGYGGIENVVAALVPALIEQGAEVELFTIGGTTLQATKNHSLHDSEQYDHIHRPWYDSLPIAVAHTLFTLNRIQETGDFDVIHSHQFYVDPLAMAYGTSLPPIVHTFHGPPLTTPDRLALNVPDNLAMWREIGRSQRLTTKPNFFVVSISKSLVKHAPRELKHIMLRPVHNGIDPQEFPFVAAKDDYFVTVGRSHPDKGWGIAARLCSKLGERLQLAGMVGNLSRTKQVMMEIGNPVSSHRGLIDFKYFSDAVFPHLDDGKIEYIGNISGQRKLKALSRAKGFLFPIQWEEPFGMVAIEAMACGTPVVAMARGSMPEIIEHGVNGFLAHNETEFEQYMQRIGEIDPAACRKSVEAKFSGRSMAKRYLQRYRAAIKRSQQTQPAKNPR